MVIKLSIGEEKMLIKMMIVIIKLRRERRGKGVADKEKMMARVVMSSVKRRRDRDKVTKKKGRRDLNF